VEEPAVDFARVDRTLASASSEPALSFPKGQALSDVFDFTLEFDLQLSGRVALIRRERWLLVIFPL
jgi:hypothetical protein